MQRDSLNGLIAGALAYVIWGLVVVYWKWVHDVSAWEVLSHRVVWCFAFLAPIILALRRWPAIREALTDRRKLVMLMISATLIAGNWGLFIWAVQAGRIIETSLGYYINPLLAIAIGVLLLGERLSTWRLVAFGLAAAGVVLQAVALGQLPWISLALATSFAIYGYVRKTVGVQALDGLFVETLLTTPFAALYLIFLGSSGTMVFGHTDWTQTLLLIGAGPVTAIPLWLFSAGARGVRMSTMGFLQYIAPTISLAIAIYMYHEPFDETRLVSFALIWSALIVVAAETFRRPPITAPAGS